MLQYRLKPVTTAKSVIEVVRIPRDCSRRLTGTTSIGRMRTDIVFRYPQLLGNVKFSWGNSPRLGLPLIRKNLYPACGEPIKFADGTTFVNWQERKFIPATMQELPPVIRPAISLYTKSFLSESSILQAKQLFAADPAINNAKQLARRFQTSVTFMSMCLKASYGSAAAPQGCNLFSQSRADQL